MSRYTLTEKDLIVTIGMDFAVQWWLVDHRGESIPLERPARLTAKDHLGQVLFDAESVENPDDPAGEIDVLNDPWLVVSPVNGMVQLVLPRNLTQQWSPGAPLTYDLWATLRDGGAGGAFPNGQQLPVARGRVVLQTRITQMEA